MFFLRQIFLRSFVSFLVQLSIPVHIKWVKRYESRPKTKSGGKAQPKSAVYPRYANLSSPFHSNSGAVACFFSFFFNVTVEENIGKRRFDCGNPKLRII